MPCNVPSKALTARKPAPGTQMSQGRPRNALAASHLRRNGLMRLETGSEAMNEALLGDGRTRPRSSPLGRSAPNTRAAGGRPP